MPLDVMSSGTPRKGAPALDEAVRVFLLTARIWGLSTKWLEESGYERQGDRWCAPPSRVERHELALACERVLGSHPCTAGSGKVFLAVGFVFARQEGSHPILRQARSTRRWSFDLQ